jgi:hypothetical protein
MVVVIEILIEKYRRTSWPPRKIPERNIQDTRGRAMGGKTC